MVSTNKYVLQCMVHGPPHILLKGSMYRGIHIPALHLTSSTDIQPPSLSPHSPSLPLPRSSPILPSLLLNDCTKPISPQQVVRGALSMPGAGGSDTDGAHPEAHTCIFQCTFNRLFIRGNNVVFIGIIWVIRICVVAV